MEITDNHLLHNLADDIPLLSSLQISPSKPIASNDIEEIQHSTDRYMAFFSDNFPTVSLFSKQHILECNCVDVVRKWGCGLGLLVEQGGKETHADINQLTRLTRGLKREAHKFRFMLQKEMAVSSPLLSTVSNFFSASPPPLKKGENVASVHVFVHQFFCCWSVPVWVGDTFCICHTSTNIPANWICVKLHGPCGVLLFMCHQPG